ncbi:hypothetical protein CRUP_021275, partial [Coryphaenoides rupestris]
METIIDSSVDSRKQLVQYSTTPILGGVAELPSMLQLQGDSFFSSPEDNPPISTTTASSSSQHPNL